MRREWSFTRGRLQAPVHPGTNSGRTCVCKLKNDGALFYYRMPYSRQRPRIAPNGRVAVRLTTVQRDMFMHAPEMPKDLAHALHRAPVRAGKLSIRATQASLAVLISVAAAHPARNREEERALSTLVRYLEGLEDRFEEPEDGEATEWSERASTEESAAG